MALNARVRCLSAHVLLVFLNPSPEKTRGLTRDECPKSEGGSRLHPPLPEANSTLALNCQFMVFTAVCLLSMRVAQTKSQCDFQPSNKGLRVFINDSEEAGQLLRGKTSKKRGADSSSFVFFKLNVRSERLTGDGSTK